MEVKLNKSLKGSSLYRAIKAVHQRIITKFPLKASRTIVSSTTPYETIPYEISEAYRVHMQEAECKRAQVLAEIRRITRLI